MNHKNRRNIHTAALRLEACHFQGILQPFPPHFHEYYVIGLVEGGYRRLVCGGGEYAIRPGHLLIFCPGIPHGCTQTDARPLDYRALHIPRSVFAGLLQAAAPPVFPQPVISSSALAESFRILHQETMAGHTDALAPFLTALLQAYGSPAFPPPECQPAVETACAFLEAHLAEHITLERLCRHAGLSKSTLLRAFAKYRGITPYRYLETLRVREAKRLLAEGVPPAEAALLTGFSDQSHLTKYFQLLTGFPPGAYYVKQKKRSEHDGCTKGEMRNHT